MGLASKAGVVALPAAARRPPVPHQGAAGLEDGADRVARPSAAEPERGSIELRHAATMRTATESPGTINEAERPPEEGLLRTGPHSGSLTVGQSVSPGCCDGEDAANALARFNEALQPPKRAFSAPDRTLAAGRSGGPPAGPQGPCVPSSVEARRRREPWGSPPRRTSWPCQLQRVNRLYRIREQHGWEMAPTAWPGPRPQSPSAEASSCGTQRR